MNRYTCKLYNCFIDDDILSASSKEIRQQLDDCQNKV